MKLISNIYNNPIYIVIVVILALISLFGELPAFIDNAIYIVFIIDLIAGTVQWFYEETEKTVLKYFRHFIFDILACIPITTAGILKIFRLIRVTRLIKLHRLENTQSRIKLENIFNFNTMKEFAIYLLIYFIANVYLFSQIEQKGVIDSIYWLVETMTSVGYGDITPTHVSTKILGMLLMLIGIATIGYLNGVITTTVVKNLNRKK